MPDEPTARETITANMRLTNYGWTVPYAKELACVMALLADRDMQPGAEMTVEITVRRVDP